VAALLVLWMALESKSNALDRRLARMGRLQLRVAEHLIHGRCAGVRADRRPCLRTLMLSARPRRSRTASVR
jgi:hypothetical protein